MIKVGTDFSGIGAPEQALKEMGIPHVVEFACDNDKYARETYLANHETKIMYEDITTRDHAKAPYVDLYCFGFPCQAFSLSGKRKGFDDVRGTLFFNSAEYIRTHRPAVFIAENVKGLLSHDKPKKSKSKHGRTFQTIINLLAKTVNGQALLAMYDDSLGYHIHYTVLNTKYYNLAQNRERVFIVGFRDEASFRFPNSNKMTKCLSDHLESNVNEKYYLGEGMLKYFSLRAANFNNGNVNIKTPKDIASTLTSSSKSLDISDNIIVEGEVTPDSQAGKVYGINGIAPAHSAGAHGYAMGYILVPDGSKKGWSIAKEGDSIDIKHLNSKTRRGVVGQGIVNALDTQAHKAVVLRGYRIRRLTPLEYMRLQGFPDSFVKPCSDTQIYKQGGNSISITVLKAIFSRIKILQ